MWLGNLAGCFFVSMVFFLVFLGSVYNNNLPVMPKEAKTI